MSKDNFEMQTYQHRQSATLILVSLGIGVAICAVVAFQNSGKEAMIIVGSVAVVLVAIMILFSSLSVRLQDHRLDLKFGLGLIRKRIDISDICSVSRVRNKWYYGWGIRMTPHGWMYNVSGLDAVQLELRSGRGLRIGTDQPAELEIAIQNSIEELNETVPVG